MRRSVKDLRCRALTTRSRATDGYAVRSPCPQAESAAAQCLTPLGWRDCPCFGLLAASIRKFGLKIKNHCTISPKNGPAAAAIRKSWPEIKNRCTVLPEIGPKAASIRKSGLEIKNHCTISPKNGPAAGAIRKSGLEIKNRCSAIVPASRIARLQQS